MASKEFFYCGKAFIWHYAANGVKKNNHKQNTENVKH